LSLPNRKKRWSLTQDTFDTLLAHLDSSRELAGAKYITLRSKLVKFFECRGCLYPEDLADETINRVAKKLCEGNIENVITYHFGVARMLFKETLSEREREWAALNDLRSFQPISEDQQKHDTRLECFNICLQSLPAESREIIISYYQGEKHAKIENRNHLAKRLGIPLNSLRIRTCRIRAKLEECISDCLR
jgi:DNA-directed RNA polymerase specialized sigma24 family protein